MSKPAGQDSARASSLEQIAPLHQCADLAVGHVALEHPEAAVGGYSGG